nr:hypothetical protein [Marinicella sp. W31]MDC2876823.1 hypothetical protein [Marinicella sp. W31]
MADQARYLLGLDAGNTVIKAVLFDLEDGRLPLMPLMVQPTRPRPV